MSNDLIDWKEDLPTTTETLSEIVGVENPEETYSHHRAALEAEQARIAAENELRDLSDADLMKQWEKAAKEHEAATLPQRQVDAVHRFIAATPELKLNSKNQQRIDAYLKVAKLDASDPGHFDQAYRALSARNLLDIDESKRVREPYKRYSQEELESMDIAQLEELARRQTR
jgi:hypothetical protein